MFKTQGIGQINLQGGWSGQNRTKKTKIISGYF